MPLELPAALVREGLSLMAVVGGPMFLAMLGVGLGVGVLQAATQVNDPAVGFLPRILAAAAVAWLAGGWMMGRLAGFFGEAVARMSGH